MDAQRNAAAWDVGILDTVHIQNEPIKILNKNFICVMLANFMHCIAHASINPFIATYMKYLDTSAQLAGFLIGMFFAVSFAVRPFAGHATTKYNKRKLLIIVFIIGTVANLGYALFHNVPSFVLFRFLSGVQYSFIGSLCMTLAADHLPRLRLTSGLGVYGVSGAIGSAIAPSVGETILNAGIKYKDDSFGFTLLFLFGSLILVLALIPAIILTPDRKALADRARIGKWYKNIISIHALPPTIVLFLIMISYAIISTYMFEFGKEQGVPNINIFYLVFAASLAVSRPISGYITDRLGIKRILYPALAVFALSMFFIGISSTFWMAIIGAILAAIGFGASQPSLQTMCIQSETALRRGVASNTLYVGIDLGFFLGPYLGGLVYAESNYSMVLKTGAIPVILSMVCLAITFPIYTRRSSELGNEP